LHAIGGIAAIVASCPGPRNGSSTAATVADYIAVADGDGAAGILCGRGASVVSSRSEWTIERDVCRNCQGGPSRVAKRDDLQAITCVAAGIGGEPQAADDHPAAATVAD